MKATDTISLTSKSKITSNVGNSGGVSAVGKVGDIELTAKEIVLTDGANLQAGFFSNARGESEIISIQAADSISFQNSKIFSNSDPGALRDSSDIVLSAKSISLSNNSSLIASNAGQGNAGSIVVKATDTISLTSNSQITSNVGNSRGVSAVGKVGNISLEAKEVALTDGANLQAGLFSNARGETGIISIIQAADSISFQNSKIFSNSDAGALGDSSDIVLSAKSISLSNSSSLIASNAGQGNAGNVKINAVDTISFDDSSAFSTLGEDAVGKGGSIDISTDKLTLIRGSLSSSTFGTGDAGNITLIISDSLSLDSTSDVQTRVNPGARGNGGNIHIQARTLSLTNGSEILAETFGEGEAGNIRVDVSDSVVISGVAPFPVLEDGSAGGFSSGLITGTEEDAKGQGGDINVNTNHFQILDGAVLSAPSRSNFRGGNIEVNANTLEVTGGGQLITTAFSQGNAGNINLNVSDRILFSGSDPNFFDRFNQVAEAFEESEVFARIDPVSPLSGIFANTTSDFTGQSGNVFVQTGKLSLDDGARLAVNSQGKGNGGQGKRILFLKGKLDGYIRD